MSSSSKLRTFGLGGGAGAFSPNPFAAAAVCRFVFSYNGNSGNLRLLCVTYSENPLSEAMCRKSEEVMRKQDTNDRH